jgi:hypothetical protein
MINSIYNDNIGEIQINQDVFDSFNNFIFSSDRNIFNKLYSRIQFYEMTKHLNGDIVEAGVFRGSGILTWLKILDMNEPNSIKRAVGFDFFNNNWFESIENTVDKEMMSQVFNRVKKLSIDDISCQGVKNKIVSAKIKNSKFELVPGDIVETSKNYILTKPGFRISILYIDLDLGEATYQTLNNFWNNIVSGGIIVLDEYAHPSWSESNGVDLFVKEHGLKIIRTNVNAPTAFIIKD